MEPERNLLLVWTPNLQGMGEYQKIASAIMARAPDIEVTIIHSMARHWVTRKRASERPTLIFSPCRLRKFQPLRGKRYVGRGHSKMEEYDRLVAGNIRTPEALILRRDTKLDPSTWGLFTVLKPDTGTMSGDGVSLQRTADTRWIDPLSWPKDDPRYSREMVAQRFIDTGPHTTCHRVTTLFGRVLWATTSRWINPRTFALDETLTEQPIAANHGERTVTLNYDKDILAFGSSVAPAFPEIPVLGVDVIRDANTGELYALEVNAGGATWHTSSGTGIAMQARNNIDVVAQFGAISVAADALIDVTRREAE